MFVVCCCCCCCSTCSCCCCFCVFFGGCFIHCRYHSKRLWCLYATVTSNEANERKAECKDEDGGEKGALIIDLFCFFVTFCSCGYWTRKLTGFRNVFFSQLILSFASCSTMILEYDENFVFLLILSHWIISKFAYVWSFWKQAAAAHLIPLIEILFIFLNEQKWILST